MKVLCLFLLLAVTMSCVYAGCVSDGNDPTLCQGKKMICYSSDSECPNSCKCDLYTHYCVPSPKGTVRCYAHNWECPPTCWCNLYTHYCEPILPPPPPPYIIN